MKKGRKPKGKNYSNKIEKGINKINNRSDNYTQKIVKNKSTN